MFCSQCGSPVSDTSKFCSSCGRAIELPNPHTFTGDEGETIAPGTTARNASLPRTPHSGSLSSRASLTSSDPISGGRFPPGLILAERYRVVSLAGRGGMGEVYRAEDLKLAQTVAIKFLPEALTTDSPALARFHSEVRTARQVSHPNVCRVFDIGETNGIPYLTMEYVDGEDLASLLRRIGRISPDKATEITRQICAGLAAAHDRGVIHRDLKPANIMLDGQGKARITDFGLAGVAATIQGAEIRAGTPAYMAPEQLSGQEVTAKSDIYSLGLILYELLTGKRAFDGASIPELLRAREQSTLTKPSTLVHDLDPLLERVILRCLEKDPSLRPSSALQVAAALPGGDPVAAALAAGETPSPEMVAASGEKEGLKPQLAFALFFGVLLALAVMLFVSKHTSLAAMLPFHEPPELLKLRAQEMVQRFGYTEKSVDTATGFNQNGDYLAYIEAHDNSPSRWDALRTDEPPPMYFWYRQSPQAMAPLTPADNLVWGRVTTFAPPMDTSGMIVLATSLEGKLLHFEALPPQVDESSGSVPAPDWSPLFAAAGIDPKDLKSVAPKWFPRAWGDSRAAWEGTWNGKQDLPFRIEAAGYRGRAIYFSVVFPWTQPTRMVDPKQGNQNRLGQIFGVVLLLTLICVAVWVARRNIRAGRGDYAGANRVAIVIFLAAIVNWILLAHHTTSPAEYVQFILAVSTGLFYGSFTWMLYVALEPYVRRYWPDTLVSWTRMLQGKFRDPVLGRDVLLGALFGVCSAILEHQQFLVEHFLGKAPARPMGFSLYALEGLRGSLALIVFQATNSLSVALLLFFLFFLLRLIFKNNWLAAAALSLLYCIPSFGAQNPFIDALFTAPFFFLYMIVLWRFGLVCLAALYFTDQLVDTVPLVTPLTAWYAEAGMIIVIAVILLSFYGFQVSRAGKPLLSRDLLEI